MEGEFEMSHNVETMAWTAEKPWHGLGFEVAGDLTPEQMLKAAKLDWTVSQHPVFTEINGEKVSLTETALVRDSDGKILSLVGAKDRWYPRQNAEAFELFHEFVQKGNMTMETAGSLQNGQIVWALAKNHKDFTVFGGDTIEAYTLLVNPHKYGWSNIAQFTGVRVVCNNTLSMALNGSRTGNIFKATHRTQITNEMVKEALGLTDRKMAEYRETALFLGGKKYSAEAALEFFNEVFPSTSVKRKNKDEPSRNARQAQLALEHQPGLEFAPGSWWQALNAVTFVTDHIMGRTADTRVYNAWLGQVKDTKLRAMKTALEFASKS